MVLPSWHGVILVHPRVLCSVFVYSPILVVVSRSAALLHRHSRLHSMTILASNQALLLDELTLDHFQLLSF